MYGSVKSGRSQGSDTSADSEDSDKTPLLNLVADGTGGIEANSGSTSTSSNGSNGPNGPNANSIGSKLARPKIKTKYAKKPRGGTKKKRTERKRWRETITSPVQHGTNGTKLWSREKESEKDNKSAVFGVSAYCTCSELALTKMGNFLEDLGKFDSLTLFGEDVLHIKQKSTQRDVFTFTYGCIVFFNTSDDDEQSFLNLIKPFEIDRVPPDDQETEDIEYTFGSKFGIKHDRITLTSHSSLEKLSVAYAMAQCVKLNVYEEIINEEIEESKHLPEELARHGTIGLSREAISKKIGKLFLERNNVNLQFDILDTPEFFWEQDKYKYVYANLFNYLELGNRVTLLNQRLDIMKELFDMLAGQLDNMHSTKLEWIIIWLILIEVFIMVVWEILIKDILGFFHN